MSDTHFVLVAVDAGGKIGAIADPSRVPRGMSLSIAAPAGHTVFQVSFDEDVMRRPRSEMLAAITRQLKDPQACRIYRPQRRRPSSA
jgi:hypothetical protein